ncbi:MAG: hypothetical protein AB8W37_10970 [Arsenophonus endosymbiont of Dermacentor nuttalli]
MNNDHKGPNYRFSLSGLNKITEITCASRYSWRNFDIDINNDLTLKTQKVSNIGNLNIASHADNNFNLTGKRVTLGIYPDKTNSAEKFTTDLARLNYTFNFNIAGQELKPNNSASNSKEVTVSLNSDGNSDIQ